MSTEPKIGAMVVPSEFSAWVMVRRLDAVSGLPEDRDERVRRHLQQRDARREDEQRQQEQRVRARAGRRIEQQAADAGGEQADDDAVLVAELVDDQRPTAATSRSTR